MWVEELSLENIKCFENTSLRFGTSKAAHKWVTLLGENGTGKSTILKALGLLLAGPEGALQLTGSRRLEGWLRDESHAGKISARIHKDDSDPGKFGAEVKRGAFGYTFHITGRTPIEIRNKQYSEPRIVENPDKILTWLRRNAFLSKGEGWFGVGYGPFRRLSQRMGQRNQITVMEPDRYSNFLTMFDENEELSRFEQWMFWLDFQVLKNGDSGKKSAREQAMGIEAINELLPGGAQFLEVDANGNIWFQVGGNKVPTQQLSDGFRSILAFTGDLIWRMLEAFPGSEQPLHEPGVILIDELDIHLHPSWQREIPGVLRRIFPNIQFIVSAHSPFIAAGAGEDTVTFRIRQQSSGISVEELKNLHAWSVDKILQSDAFNLSSVYSPQTQQQMDEYYSLKRKKKLSVSEEEVLESQKSLVREAVGKYGPESELEEKMDDFIKKHLA